ncbi:D-aminoacyl-tRNA deacylase [Mycoplasmatota bacterium WC30]
MKVIVQRVKTASVTCNGKVFSKIDQGFLLFVGLKQGDTFEEVNYVARKVAKLRIFSDENDKMNLDINDVSGKILSISQFTLYGDTNKSNRPSFTTAMNYKEADLLYNKFNQILRNDYNIEVLTGVFGEHMDVALINDGPVTITIEKNNS